MSEFTPFSVVNIAAYKFVTLDRLPERREALRQQCRKWELKGTILLSREGINLFLAGSRGAVDEVLAALRQEPEFSDLSVKESLSREQPFGRMIVKIKREIIPFGIGGIDPRVRPTPKLAAGTLKSWLDAGRNVTLLDVRNNYEIEHGTFSQAQPIGIDHFRQFPDRATQLEEDLKQRPLVMFCTGGIRCEKAGPYLEQQGFAEVYQLAGGILKYFEECGDEHFRGACFVFDERVTVDPPLRGRVETM